MSIERKFCKNNEHTLSTDQHNKYLWKCTWCDYKEEKQQAVHPLVARINGTQLPSVLHHALGGKF
jgi:hypothetical protein